MEKCIENFNCMGNVFESGKLEGDGMVKFLVEKVFVVDFFFIFFIFVWLVVGLGEKFLF